MSLVGTGLSLTSVTVNTNVSTAVWPLVAVTVTVMVAVPSAGLLAFNAGVMSSVRVVPEPPTRMLAFGTSVVLPEVAVTEAINAPVPITQVESDLRHGVVLSRRLIGDVLDRRMQLKRADIDGLDRI